MLARHLVWRSLPSETCVLTDDRAARKLAAQLKIPISGMLGVLLRLVQIDVLTMPEANELLGQMIAAGYRSPVEKVEDL